MPDELPCLPRDDDNPAARADALARARSEYVYDRSFHGLLFVEHLPREERFDAPYLARGAAITAALGANRVALAASDQRHGGPGPYPTLFQALRTPLASQVRDEDDAAGWQRIAGPNPAYLRRVEAVADHLPLHDDDIGDGPGGLARALAGGRIYEVDYALFADVPLGEVDGHPKFLLPATGAFVATDRGLRPLAIQPLGHQGDATSVVRPHQGDRWRLARLALQVADENFQGVVAHMGWCHLVAQRFLLAMQRCLAPQHPLHVLLAPHFRFTLAVNQVARSSVLVPGGVQDRLLAPVLDDQLRLLREHVAAVDLASLDPTIDFARRGVADREALPVYPFRDDSLLYWDAMAPFIADYVALYYPDDDAVHGDAELQSFLAELGAPEAGGLPRLVEGEVLATPDDVTYLLRRIIHRVTAFHGAINDENYEWAAYPPSMPTAAFAPLHSDAPLDGLRLAQRLPPREVQLEAISATYNVAELKQNHIGRYPAFADPRVAPLVEALQASLRAVGQTIEARNADRLLPYLPLHPDRLCLSINA